MAPRLLKFISSWALALCAVSLGMDAEASSLKAVTLEQWCSLTGKCKVFASEKAIKIVNLQNNWGLIARAPDWKVYVYNDRTRHYLISTADRWHGQLGKGFSYLADGGLSDCRWQAGKVSHLDGLSIKEEVSETIVPDTVAAAFGMRKREKINHSSLFVLTGRDSGVSVPLQGLRIIANNYSMPALDGILVSVHMKGDQSTAKDWLKTTSIKAVAMSDADFALPKYYEKVQDAYHLNANASEISDFVGNMHDPADLSKADLARPLHH